LTSSQQGLELPLTRCELLELDVGTR